MNLYNLTQKAGEYEASVEVEPTGDGFLISVCAPYGHQWADGPVILLANFGGTHQPLAEAVADLIERMDCGLNVNTEGW